MINRSTTILNSLIYSRYDLYQFGRDRDRIRQSHLERLGWKFHRIWGPSWAKRKEEEIEKVLSVIDDAIKSGEVVNKINSKTKKKRMN